MRNSAPKILLPLIIVTIVLSSCVKDDPATLVPPPTPDQSFVEEFDTVGSAYHRGWVPINNSNPKGSSIWSQGGAVSAYFPAYSSKGSFAGFVGTDYLSTSADAAVISNWLISPAVIMKNGDKIVFYTRCLLLDTGTGDSTDYGNNIEICINRQNDGTNVGVAHDPRDAGFNVKTDRGDFEVLFSLNPAVYDPSSGVFTYHNQHSDPTLYDPLAYPANWTRFEITVSGLSAPHKGRFAFRYYTLDGGANGNGTAIGIDSVAYVSKK